MSEGATQSDRLPAALQPEQMFQVDDTSLEQLLVMTRELARRLRFVGIDMRVEGTWGALLEHDQSVLIARSQTLDLPRRDAEFLDEFAAARPEELARRVQELRTWLIDWARTLSEVREPWAQLMAARVDELMSIAGTDLPVELTAEPAALNQLRSAYFGLSNAIRHLSGLARGVWADSLKTRTHEPAAAMLVAFCQLLGQVQARINAFAERLTDFYYLDVLQMRARKPHPDTVHLLFRRDPTYTASVVVPGGSPFIVQRPGAAPITFVAENTLTVTDHTVEALYTLRLQRDGLITPEARFGFVTSAKADRFAAEVGLDDEARQISVALLGADARGAMRQGDDARLGLAISSPVLWLAEGERRITVTLVFDFGGEPVRRVRRELREAAAAKDEPRFSRALGRLFARWVVSDLGRRSEATLRLMRRLARPFVGELDTYRVHGGVVDDGGDGLFDEERYSPTDPFVLLLAAREADRADESRRELIRDEVIENLFRVALSTPSGWYDFYRPVMVGAGLQTEDGRHSLSLVVELANEDPAVVACTPDVHGAEWSSAAPTLRLTLNKNAGIFPVSLLAGAVLRAVDIGVEVMGLRDVQAFNQLGPLDTTRPFMPFGPLPTTASYVVVGAPELARKYPTFIELRPEWSGLPARGFSYHYAEYDSDYGAGVYTAQAAILRDGLWGRPAARPSRLFVEGAPPEGLPIVVDPEEVRARWRPTPGEFTATPGARNGLIRLQLAAPEGGFGHQEYPVALTAAVGAKAKDKRARPMPNPPYAPLLERITLNYAASAWLELGQAGAAAEGETILHLHPFGTEEIHPRGWERPHGLIPDVGQDGNLYIALSGSPPQGPLTLLFDLRRSAAVDALARQRPRAALSWAWLDGDLWRPLEPHRVLSDTTSGFLAPGIVTLDLPPGMTRDHSIMPAGSYWLRVSSDAPSGAFAGLKGVRAQALRAVRRLDAAPPEAPLPPHAIVLNSAPLPGLLAIEQPEPGFGLRPAETQEAFRTRVGERLRHKQRASTPWDYERLVLEAFPYVHKVRCLPHRRDDKAGVSPGHVLVVAVPQVPAHDPRYLTRRMRLDPLQLDDIETYLSGLASPGVRVAVRNPSYDLVQVRCRVGLAEGADVGEGLRRISAAIIEHLSPWHDAGGRAPFDWRIRAEDVETWIRGAGAVETVKGVSLIHVWDDPARAGRAAFRFRDTALESAGPVEIGCHHPWSLALPMDEHFIEVQLEDQGDAPISTGVLRGPRVGQPDAVAGVEVGRTFVVGGPI